MTDAPSIPHGRDAGFTLVELCVGIAAGMLVGSLAYGAFLFALRAVDAARRAVVLENNAHLVLQRVAADVTYAARLEAVSGTTWVVTRVYRPAVRYRHAGRVLWRDDTRMHDADLEVARFRLAAVPVPAPATSLEAAGEDDAPRRVTIALTLASPRDTLSLETTVAVRSRRPWAPLPPPGETE